ncbi:DUF421 domain-containing protein [Sphingomonas sp. CFBP8993]|uniref:DUF421 domain-containing protein n=1 Tax=Sphingomonas sp. CFBP8993 TaxID=3096526 RepID=UPI002A69C850|nr:YetF domain-containing protein [Sphingomonas sp. CFBP8993]MDY0959753.1 DUF421 domain-containing protein [Sphingomonas sp. CFBP8993]
MPDWSAMFVPELQVAEVVLRGTIMYLFLVLVMRFLLKREGGDINIADLVVVVAVVDGAQPAFSGDAQSITESMIFVLTIIFWAWMLNWVSYRFRPLRFLTMSPPLMLVEDGRLCRANMRRALMTRDELMQQLREEGVEDLALVRHAMMEGDGRISVVRRKE